jgi:Ni,Fe-hydrogenase I cytochrome b subunit
MNFLAKLLIWFPLLAAVVLAVLGLFLASVLLPISGFLALGSLAQAMVGLPTG